MDNQRSIKKETTLEGIGLHTGAKVRATFRPAPPNAGIRFFRSDLKGTPMLPARLAFVVDTHRGTTLSTGGDTVVHTVEHVLSACAGLGVDNLDVVLDAPEPPAADGSALPFLQALLSAGIDTSRAPRRTMALPHEVRYENGATSYVATPSDRFELVVTLEHEKPIAIHQTIALDIDPDSYLGQVAPARTFAFEHEVEYLKAHGLSKGGSLKNCVVIGKDRVLTDEDKGLRYPDEFVRHKVLDLIGDLTLIGRTSFKMRIEARRCGHTHNIAFAKLLDQAAQKLRSQKSEVRSQK